VSANIDDCCALQPCIKCFAFQTDFWEYATFGVFRRIFALFVLLPEIQQVAIKDMDFLNFDYWM
jgi:hypothetical protein